MTIGNSMVALFDWKGSQGLITGILPQEGAEYRVEPRRDSDVYQDDASDTCL